MASVTQFAQFLLNNEPQKNVARLSLYHFIKNFDHLNSPFDENIIKEFYFHCYLHEYWRKNRQYLEKVVKECVFQFDKTISNIKTSTLDQGLFRLQVISLEKDSDFKKTIEVYLNHQIQHLNTQQKSLKCIPIHNRRMLCLIQNPDQSLEVLMFSEHFTLMDGYMVPLTPVTHLKYDNNLELKKSVSQKLEIDSSTIAKWQIRNGLFVGHWVRGYSFQKTNPFQVHSLSDVNDVFLNLKKLESHFLNLSSDPYYKETVTLLEKSIQFIESGDPAALPFASQSLKKAQYVLKSAFPHDKLLSLLVSNLEYAIVKSKLSGKVDAKWPKNQLEKQNQL